MRFLQSKKCTCWIQTLSQEKVKTQVFDNLTQYPKSLSKVRSVYEIRVFECMCKCKFFQKIFKIFLLDLYLRMHSNMVPNISMEFFRPNTQTLSQTKLVKAILNTDEKILKDLSII